MREEVDGDYLKLWGHWIWEMKVSSPLSSSPGRSPTSLWSVPLSFSYLLLSSSSSNVNSGFFTSMFWNKLFSGDWSSESKKQINWNKINLLDWLFYWSFCCYYRELVREVWREEREVEKRWVGNSVSVFFFLFSFLLEAFCDLIDVFLCSASCLAIIRREMTTWR